MAGDERYLGEELLAAVTGQPLPTKTYLRGSGGELTHLYSGLGSQNIPLLRWAVRLWTGCVEAPDTWLAILSYQRRHWMGSELGSRIYATWHFGAVLAVYAWAGEHRMRHPLAAELERAAGEWLLHWWCLCALLEAPDGQILMVGMRSAGHPPEVGKLEWLLALARGDDDWRHHWEREGRRLKLGLLQRWETLLAMVLRGSVRDSAAALDGADHYGPAGWRRALEVMPRLGLRSGINVYRTGAGLAVWIDDADGDDDDNDNSNTAPIMGAVWTAHGAQWLPPGGGRRIRQRHERATCRRVHGRLVYFGSEHGEHTLALPEGVPVHEVRLGYAAPVPAPAPAPEKPAVAQPAPPAPVPPLTPAASGKPGPWGRLRDLLGL